MKKNTLATLIELAINEDLDNIKQNAAESVFIFDRLVLKGQSSTLFAPPNAGKTLLIINQLKQAHAAGLTNDLSVFYINADDTQNGVIEKTEILESIGVHVLVPGYNGFESHSLLAILDGLSDDDAAKDVVIIVDTLKKFADTMDKKHMRRFGITVRDFVMRGGTFIGLGHTNKNRDGDNKLVYSGTSDLVEDVDCIYMMDIKYDNTDENGTQTKHIQLINQKLRGNNALELTFAYQKAENLKYVDMINSVRNIDENTHKKAKSLQDEVFKYNDYLDKYPDAVSLIKSVLDGNKMDKTELRDFLLKNTTYGRDKCAEIIDRVSGKLINFEVSGKTGRKKIYYLINNA
ncbi:TPA: hypothetical protein NK348_004634 [Vibrio parahaemolyticus]|uniref:AAA family ATPase n=1 Tax=Vibrio chemaguriensis TaxID=2527672 RepID=A0ABX1I3A3_9VIBR|nr:hypothetical protein [Vibrio chemaguriensis]EGR3149951.1 hypothetical protein [Vibrio parahaemolyticus]EGR3164238.1 hypothetical protein [Vibrio parahaemolyticus]EJG0321647.1 hypothetical protein [Vibrio parahaemolyticus]EJG0430168.1 hypothetical protein [Vibrio parahaemolyticus]NKJ70555.1 hypothetical protein [Vibrio chemaguriensis]